MSVRRLLTLHAPMGRELAGPGLTGLADRLRDEGVKKWWISHEHLPDVVVMADVPDDLMESVTNS